MGNESYVERIGVENGGEGVGRNVQQLFFFDVEGGGVECVYTPPPEEEKQEL